jgi:hypothetical protein
VKLLLGVLQLMIFSLTEIEYVKLQIIQINYRELSMTFILKKYGTPFPCDKPIFVNLLYI